VAYHLLMLRLYSLYEGLVASQFGFYGAGQRFHDGEGIV
jgi:hypothetical protein